jgi:tRNA nucleotidyltransferase/poly(A) polymerase
MTNSIARNIATAIARTLQENGFVAVFAGGCVRDSFLGVEPKDFDIATNATPARIKEIFKDDTCLAVGESFGVIIVVRDGEQIEIATFRGDGQYGDGRRPDSVVLLSDIDPIEALKEDAARRDLTINAMFFDPIAEKLYDFFDGRSDIEKRLLRAVGDASQRFAEDRLRMLRVVRFAARLDFQVEPGLLAALKKHAPELAAGRIVSYERIAKELEGILLSKSPVVGLELLMESGLMAEILPEMLEMVGERAVQDPIWHPEGTAWVHTMMVLGEAAKRTDNKSFPFMLGVFLHDIAKPRTMTTREEKHGDEVIVRVSNRGHAEVGFTMAQAICRRFKLSSETSHRVCEIVRMHMQMHDFNDPSIKRSKLVRLMQRPDIHDLIEMQHADSLGTGRTLEERQESSHRDFYLALLSELENDLSPSRRLNAPPLVTGLHIKEMGFKPGPIFRVVKQAAMEAQHEGEFTDSGGAQKWLSDNADRFKQMSAAEIAALADGDFTVALPVQSQPAATLQKSCC